MKLNLVTEVSTRDFDKDGSLDFVHLTGTLGNEAFNITDTNFGTSAWALPSNAASVNYYLDLGAGDDVAVLGSGDDTIFDYLGTDNYDAGAGFDTLQLVGKRAAWGDISAEADNGSRTISDIAGNNTKTINNIEQIQFNDAMTVLTAVTTELDIDADGSADAMLYAGTELADTLAASDSQLNLAWNINGNLGNDSLTGGNANDRLNGGAGDDQLSGGTGVDTAVYNIATAYATISQIKLTNVEGVLTEDASNGTVNGFEVSDVAQGYKDLLVDMEVIEFSDGLVSLTSSEEVLSSFSLSSGLVDTRYVTGTQFGDSLASSSYVDEITGGAGDDTFVIAESAYKTVTVTDFAGLKASAAQDVLQFDSTDNTSLFGIDVSGWFASDVTDATKADIVTTLLSVATFDTDTGNATFRFTGDNNLYLSNVSADDLSATNIDIV